MHPIQRKRRRILLAPAKSILSSSNSTFSTTSDSQTTLKGPQRFIRLENYSSLILSPVDLPKTDSEKDESRLATFPPNSNQVTPKSNKISSKSNKIPPPPNLNKSPAKKSDETSKNEISPKVKTKLQPNTDNSSSISLNPLTSKSVNTSSSLIQSNKKVSMCSNNVDSNKEESIKPIPVKPKKPSDVSSSTKFLKNWVPKLRKGKLIVEGDLLDTRSQSRFEYRWSSSVIVKRKTARHIETKSSPYVLEGDLYPGEQTPNFIVIAFSSGFPENWKDYVHKWININQCHSEVPSVCRRRSSRLIEAKEISSSSSSSSSMCSSVSRFSMTRKKTPIFKIPSTPTKPSPKPAESPTKEFKVPFIKTCAFRTSVESSYKKNEDEKDKSKFSSPCIKLAEKVPCYEKSPLERSPRKPKTIATITPIVETPKAKRGRKPKNRQEAIKQMTPDAEESLKMSENKRRRRRRYVKNPFLNELSTTKDTPKEDSTLNQKSSPYSLDEFVSNPKTVSQSRKNDAILKAINANHTDDLFREVQIDTSKGRNNIDIRDLFESDSDDNEDISIHTPRTPIFQRCLSSGGSSIHDDDVIDEDDFTKGFKEDAYIHRKAKETRRFHKLLRTRPTDPLPFESSSSHSLSQNKKKKRKDITVEAKARELVQPIAKILQHQDKSEEESESNLSTTTTS